MCTSGNVHPCPASFLSAFLIYWINRTFSNFRFHFTYQSIDRGGIESWSPFGFSVLHQVEIKSKIVKLAVCFVFHHSGSIRRFSYLYNHGYARVVRICPRVDLVKTHTLHSGALRSQVGTLSVRFVVQKLLGYEVKTIYPNDDVNHHHLSVLSNRDIVFLSLWGQPGKMCEKPKSNFVFIFL